MKVIQTVTFFGSAESKEDSPNYKDTFEIAKLVAQSGRTVVDGGGPGAMLAAATGAKSVGGKAIAVYYTPKSATSFEGKSLDNIADETYEEENYIRRTEKLLVLGDMYICVNGGTGTISEFAMAWEVARLYFGHHKPVILFGKFWNEIIDTFKKNMYIPDEATKVLYIVETPDEVLKKLEEIEVMIKLNRHIHQCVGDECYFML